MRDEGIDAHRGPGTEMSKAIRKMREHFVRDLQLSHGAAKLLVSDI